ncbi:tRNA (guanosine(46)-N7)-methyltransferase TrmB [Bacteroidota bacterium]
MPKRKLKKYAENHTFNHLIQPAFDEVKKGLEWKGKWASEFFGNTNPIVLELGCGKGEYTVGLAEVNPKKNFIGVDIKGARLWTGCKQVSEKGLKNTAFIRTDIGLIDQCFSNDEISEIWITFPDPQPKKRKEKKRLTSPGFLSKYAHFLKSNAVIHLKSDNLKFFNYSLKIIESGNHHLHYATSDLYHSDYHGEANNIKTYYEEQFLKKGFQICYLKFSLNKNTNNY